MPRPVTKPACSEEWKPVIVIEMKKFLGLIFVTGIVRKPKSELNWSTRGIFLFLIFQQTMSRNRFQLIQKYLHFSDNNAAGTNEDCLYHHHHLTRPKARAEHLHLLQQNVHQKMTPLAGLMGN
jgi:hypothetical protein